MHTKRLIGPLVLILLIAGLTSCRKQCTCIRYDSQIETFTPEEVERLSDGNCTNMRHQSGIDYYYSKCYWE